MKYFSMFSGIGGFELGIERSIGGECIGYSEIDKYAIAIYERHFKHKNYGDATKISELPDFDWLVGGFPCQAFSIAGKRRGFDESRGTLFFDIARILKDKKPKHFLLENVKGLLSHDSGRTFQTIIGILSDLGYFVQWQVLNSKNFGVPQNRERVFFIGSLRGECKPKILSFGTYFGENTRFQSEEGKEGSWISCLSTRYGQRWSGESYIKESDKTTIQNAKVRSLTPIEAERLQGFPDGWTEGESDTQRYKCLGNAVTVNVIEAIFDNLNR